MSEKLFDISDPRLLESGVWPSLNASKIPLWQDGNNINFREGSAQKMAGWEELGDNGEVINCIQQAFVAGKERAYMGSASKLSLYEDGVVSDIETGLSAGYWSMSPWGNWLLATNGVDAPRLWKNAGAPVLINTSFDTAEIVRVLKFHTVFFNTTGSGSNGPERLAWSSEDNPELTVPDVINSAGGLNIRNISSPIQAAELFGDYIAFYSLDQMYLLEYVGGQLVFGYDENMSGIGALGKNVVVPVGRRHFGLERRGFWVTDGAQEDFIDEPPVKDYLQGLVDFSRTQEIVSFHNRRRAQVEWFFPTQQGGYAGIAYQYDNRHWAPRNFRLSATQAGKVFSGPLAAATTKLVKLETGVNAGTSPLTASLTTKPIVMQQTDYFKFLDEIRLELTKVGSLMLEVGLMESINKSAPVEWLTGVEAQEHNFIEREAVAFVLRFTSTDIDVEWSVSQIEFFGAVAGAKI